MKKLIPVFTFLVIVSMLLTACGGGGNGKEDVPVDPAGEEEVEDQAEDEEQEDMEEVEQEMLPGF